MGLVYAEIILKNAGDVSCVRHGYMKETEIRQTTVTALADTGSVHLVINEDIRRQLGLSVESTRERELADGSVQACGLTEPVQIHWKDRDTVCQALVASNASDVLLGIVPLGYLDLIVDPVNQELVGAHGDQIVYRV